MGFSLASGCLEQTADGGANGFGGGIGAYDGSHLAIVDSIIGSNYALLHGGEVEVVNSTFGTSEPLIGLAFVHCKSGGRKKGAA